MKSMTGSGVSGAGLVASAGCWLRARGLSVATLLLTTLLALLAPNTTMAADLPREMHGRSDGFIAPGIAIAWAILRGPTEAQTNVILRIEVDHMRYDSVSIDGVDPFGGERRQRLPRTPLATPTDVQLSRAQFADAPRTELRFHPPRAAVGSEPTLIVYYLGVPDTTPEFSDAKSMDAFMGPRIGELFRQALKQ